MVNSEKERDSLESVNIGSDQKRSLLNFWEIKRKIKGTYRQVPYSVLNDKQYNSSHSNSTDQINILKSPLKTFYGSKFHQPNEISSNPIKFLWWDFEIRIFRIKISKYFYDNVFIIMLPFYFRFFFLEFR